MSLSEAFKAFDCDGNNYVSENEMAIILTSLNSDIKRD